jgi:predicted alpha/beta superfamily hydrolase
MRMSQSGIEVRELHSHILNQDLEVHIKLPWTYDRGDKSYPILYTLDANRTFPLYATSSLIFETPGFNNPEILIAGIGYQLDNDRLRGLAQWAAWRTRDLTPVRREETEAYWNTTLAKLLNGEHLGVQTGGAVLFLQSILEEVIPFVEANYRVSSSNRGLAGYSYGGLFALFALFHTPGTFKRYFAGSPSMWEVLFKYEQTYAAQHTDLQARLLITRGSRETDLLEPIQQMVDRLRSRNYPGLELLTHMFENEGHTSAHPAAISRALSALYYEG